MGKGKKWLPEESKAVAKAWLAMSEDVGNQKIKGTNQDSDEFWALVQQQLSALALQNCLKGTYGERDVSALQTHFKDHVA
jgi:hypothetical protein